MATRSTIAIENNDGTVSQVYCHWDGYLEGVGKTLLDHYDTREAVEKLLAGGSISSLGEYVSDDEKSFDKKYDDEDDYTVYYTYRGEDPVSEEFESLSDYEENHQYEEFEYIFTQDNVWSVFFNGDWHDLELELSEKK
jgi:hypothetical protein